MGSNTLLTTTAAGRMISVTLNRSVLLTAFDPAGKKGCAIQIEQKDLESDKIKYYLSEIENYLATSTKHCELKIVGKSHSLKILKEILAKLSVALKAFAERESP